MKAQNRWIIYLIFSIAVAGCVYGCTDTKNPAYEALQKADAVDQSEQKISYYLEMIAAGYENIGNIQEESEHWQEAAEAFSVAATIYFRLEHIGDSKVKGLLIKAGQLYRDKEQNYKEAAKKFRSLLEIYPEYKIDNVLADAVFRLGNDYFGKGNYYEAASAYKYARELFTQDYEEHKLSAHKKIDDALAKLDEAKKHDIEGLSIERIKVELLGPEEIHIPPINVIDKVTSPQQQLKGNILMTLLVVILSIIFILVTIVGGIIIFIKISEHSSELQKLHKKVKGVENQKSPTSKDKNRGTSQRSTDKIKLDVLGQNMEEVNLDIQNKLDEIQLRINGFGEDFSDIEVRVHELERGLLEGDSTSTQPPDRLITNTYNDGYNSDGNQFTFENRQDTSSPPILTEEKLIKWWEKYGAYDLSVCAKRLQEWFGEDVEMKVIEKPSSNPEKWDMFGVRTPMDGFYYIVPLRNGFYPDSVRKYFRSTSRNPSQSATIKTLVKVACVPIASQYDPKRDPEKHVGEIILQER